MLINSVLKMAISLLQTAVAVLNVLKNLAPFVQVIGSPYGFGKTCISAYKDITSTRAIISSVKGIVINCSSRIIKYPTLCAAMLAALKKADANQKLLLKRQLITF